jgi:hypothetical protein
MRKTIFTGGLVVLLTFWNGSSLHAQGFEWLMPYDQLSANVDGEDVKVARNGEVFSQYSYWDIPPIRESGTVIDRYGLALNRVWRFGVSGKGSYVSIRFACHDNGDAYVLHLIPTIIPKTELRKRATGAGHNWDTTLIGSYDKIVVAKDRIFLFGMLPDTGGIGTNRGYTIVQFDTMRNAYWRRDTLFPQNMAIRRTETYADENGNMYVTGTVEWDEKDVFILKYDIDGNLVCGKWMRGPVGRTEEGFGITADRAGNFYLLSKVDGADNVNAAWITKFDPVGLEIWSRSFASEKNLGLQSIHATVDDELVVSGGYESRIQLVFRVDTSGAMQWRMPTDSVFTFRTMAVGPDGALYFSNLRPGWTSSSSVRYLAKYSFHPVSVEPLSDNKGLLSTFLLSQNFPNPFNPSTTIEYSIPTRGNIRLAVYDHLGREIAVLADGEHQAGTHSSRFTATEQPSGVYMYRLSWNGNSVARRMVLLR